LKLEFRRIFRYLYTFCKDLQPFLLSHHLDCDHFKDHYFILKGIKFCKGCMLGIPVFLVTVLLLSLFPLIDFTPKVYVLIGMVLISVNIISVSHKIKQIAFLKVLAKISLAIGAWFYVYWYFYF